MPTSNSGSNTGNDKMSLKEFTTTFLGPRKPKRIDYAMYSAMYDVKTGKDLKSLYDYMPVSLLLDIECF